MLVTFAVGNSDNKLTQAAWSALCGQIHVLANDIVIAGGRIQFAGYSSPVAPWQNALWAIEVPDVLREDLRARLGELAGPYRQDAIAWWEVDQADMIKPIG